MRSARGDSSLSLAVAGNLLIIYILWGSTYLAIRLALDTLPPFLSAATRFLIAGALMVGFLWLRGRFSNSPSAKLEPIRKEHWRSAAIIGGLLLFGGNGLVVQSEQYIDSGVAAVLIAAVPIWMNLLEALATRRRPSALVIAGVVAGFAGVVVLIAPVNGLAAINPLGVGLAVIAAMSWATGSIYSRSAPMPRSGLLGTGMEMLAGGAILVVAGIVTGELGRTHPAQFSLTSLLAVAYLVVFGSLVAFSAYTWLLRHAPVSTVATYAYVNPIVAVALGAFFLQEPITLRTIIASVLILGAVIAMVSGRQRETDVPAGEPKRVKPSEGVDRAAAD
jgi:drug/metabolite transporter (DMT)-like permease